ncbi:MAG: PD40 domain-containing protein [Planctomycetes bacterium]|nr:PD40 domain-containing protein [Planctomycetota bacterium]
MKRFVLSLGVLVLLAAGCFPVLLDVDSKGRALVPRDEGVFVIDLKTGQSQLVMRSSPASSPAWARWSPDGKAAMVVSVSKDADNKFLLDVVTLADGKRRHVADLGTVALALWSPDGKKISVVESGMGDAGLKVIDAATGDKKPLLDPCASSHQWTPDGKIVAFSPNENVGGDKASDGRLLLVDPAGGEPKTIAEARCTTMTVLDLSPDGKQVLIVEKRDDKEQLALFAVADGTKKTLLPENVKGAFWSPDGKRIAVLIKAGDDDDKGVNLVVTDAEGKQSKELVAGVMENTGETMSSLPVYPTWADKDTILFFRKVSVYGTSGKAMHLFSIKADGGDAKDLQLTVDNGVASALKEK